MPRRVAASLPVFGLVWFVLHTLATSSAWAGQHAITGANVRVWLPDHWTLVTTADEHTDDGHPLAATSPDASVAVVFVSRTDAEVSDTLTLLDEELAGFVDDIETDGRPERGVHNEMDAARLVGRGQVDGDPVVVSLLVLRPPAGDPLIALAIVRQDASADDLATLDEILDAMTPAPVEP